MNSTERRVIIGLALCFVLQALAAQDQEGLPPSSEQLQREEALRMTKLEKLEELVSDRGGTVVIETMTCAEPTGLGCVRREIALAP